MEIKIRPAVEADSEAIRRLNRESLGYDFDPERARERLASLLGSPYNRIFVAEVGNIVAGYAHAADYNCTYMEPLKNLLAIAVDPNMQGHGVGRALLDAVEKWARQDGASGVRLVSGSDRHGAHLFYLTCGYTVRKECKNFIKVFD